MKTYTFLDTVNFLSCKFLQVLLTLRSKLKKNCELMFLNVYTFITYYLVLN